MSRHTVSIMVLLVLGIAAAGCDLATKHWVSEHLSVARADSHDATRACAVDSFTGHVIQTRQWVQPLVLVGGVLELVYAENCNGAFGVLHQLTPPVRRVMLLVGNLLAAAALLTYASRRGRGALVTHAGVALVLAGAFGNAYDRLTRGYVVDFIRAHWHRFEWPVFNVADIAIVVGVGLMLLDSAREQTSRKPPPPRVSVA